MKAGHLDFHLGDPNCLRSIVHFILALTNTSDAACHNFTQWRENLDLRIAHVPLPCNHEACLSAHWHLFQTLPGQVHLGCVHNQAFEGASRDSLSNSSPSSSPPLPPSPESPITVTTPLMCLQ